MATRIGWTGPNSAALRIAAVQAGHAAIHHDDRCRAALRAELRAFRKVRFGEGVGLLGAFFELGFLFRDQFLRVFIELVLDGLHVHPDIAALAFASAPGRIALVTDAMAAAGSSDGDYQLGSLAVTVAGGKAVLRGTDTIAGSTLTLDRALRIAISAVGLSPREAVEAVTLTPARALGLEARLGLLAPGFAADAVLLDHAWGVTGVWGAGSRIPVPSPAS